MCPQYNINAVARVPVQASAKVQVWFKAGYRGLEGCYFLLLGLEACLRCCFRDNCVIASQNITEDTALQIQDLQEVP